MTPREPLTDADLLDYIEGRLSRAEGTLVARRLAADPALAARCARLRQRVLHVRMLRSILPLEAAPEEWLDLLAKCGRR